MTPSLHGFKCNASPCFVSNGMLAILSPGRMPRPSRLFPNGDCLWARAFGGETSSLVLLLGIIGARLTVQKAALLDGGTALVGAGAGSTADAAVMLGGAVVAVGRGEVGDVLGNRVLGAHGARVDRVALASLGHGIVAAVEVLAVLQVLREVVRLGGQLAVEAEEALLLGRESLVGQTHVSNRAQGPKRSPERLGARKKKAEAGDACLCFERHSGRAYVHVQGRVRWYEWVGGGFWASSKWQDGNAGGALTLTSILFFW